MSFYGASYIHLPVQEAKGATDISFRFRTHLADAMLLLAAGKTDYCLIKLEAGRLKVRLPLALTPINRHSGFGAGRLVVNGPHVLRHACQTSLPPSRAEELEPGKKKAVERAEVFPREEKRRGFGCNVSVRGSYYLAISPSLLGEERWHESKGRVLHPNRHNAAEFRGPYSRRANWNPHS